MIYSDVRTISAVAESLTDEINRNIWIGNHIDINGLPQYDHITYNVYEVEDKLEVELSSPLLEGDRLEIIDGDLYHYHKMMEIIFNGDNNGKWRYGDIEYGWTQNDYRGFYCYGVNDNKLPLLKNSGIGYCNKLCTVQAPLEITGEGFRTKINDMYLTIRIHKDKFLKEDLGIQPDANGFIAYEEAFKSWLQANPITVVHELANPYYELVKPNVGLLNAEQGLYLNISDSIVPVVNHQDLCTLKLNYLLPNVEYKVKFKANNAGSIAINLGGTLVPLDVVEGWNEVMVTTPETLVDEYLKVNGSEGIKIQNVMVIDSNKDFDYFKGMNNTFDEIPVKNICKNRTLTYTHGVDKEGVSPQGEMNVNVAKGKVVTVVGKVSNNPDNLPISINLYYINNEGVHPRAYGKNKWIFGDVHASSWYSILACEEFELPAGTYTIHSTTEQKYEKPPWMALENNETLTYYSLPIVNGMKRTMVFNETITDINLYSNGYNAAASNNNYMYFTNIQIEEGNVATAYEPPEFNVNANPIFINPDENGYFAITIRADRDYANRIGFNVGDAFACEANDQVTITDLMVFEGDILDCQPTTYVDPADTRYLVEYKSIGNPFGFGKNKLI
jgi:hypothetical protein